MLWIVAAVAGAVIGIIAYAMSRNRVNFFYYFIFGIIGGVVGTWFFFFVLGMSGSSVSTDYWLTILWSVVGSAVILAMVEGVSMSAARPMSDRRYEGRGIAHEYEEKPERRDEWTDEEGTYHRKRK